MGDIRRPKVQKRSGFSRAYVKYASSPALTTKLTNESSAMDSPQPIASGDIRGRDRKEHDGHGDEDDVHHGVTLAVRSNMRISPATSMGCPGVRSLLPPE
jgi:hypothetical protein